MVRMKAITYYFMNANKPSAGLVMINILEKTIKELSK